MLRRIERVDDVITTPCFVTVTLEDKAYGGPEEGGWWYDVSDPIEKHYCANLSVLRRVIERVTREFDNTGRYPIHSVLSEGIFQVWIGDEIPEAYPACRPHYE